MNSTDPTLDLTGHLAEVIAEAAAAHGTHDHGKGLASMSEATRIVIDGPGLHIPAGDTEDDGAWRPTLCGGGVPNPGPEKTIPEADVCPACMQVVKDTGHPRGALAERMAAEYQGEPISLLARNLHRAGMLRVLDLLEADGMLNSPGYRAGYRAAGNAATRNYEAAETARAEAERLRGLLGELWLYVGWRHVTKQLTTDQKELWAAAVEAWQRDLHKDDPRTLAELHPADRWWLCPTCGVSISSGLDDGPHEECMWAEETHRG